MKISCAQFEGLISFYLNDELSDKLRLAFEEHMYTCPTCHTRFNMLSSIINELKDAYNQIINEEKAEIADIVDVDENKNVQMSELSAYIDNELSDENSIKVRKNIITKPKLRKKLEKMYKLRKIVSDAFLEHKNKMRVDYSKDVMRSINKSTNSNQVYLHCVAFMMFLMLLIGFSVWLIINTV